jgi:hypothetical protein
MSALESLAGSMTLAELARLAHTSVENIVNAAFGATRKAPAASTRPASAPAATAPAAGKPRGKLPRGGLSLDNVLAALSGHSAPVKLEDVRAKTGGTVPQVRAALQKLAQAKKVQITGQRRGTRYTLR